MFYNRVVDANLQQLQLLSSEMSLEPDGDVDCRPVLNGKQMDKINISEAVVSGGKTVKLLKTLITSACERNCYYCPFRAGRNMRRATFKPEEMAETFIKLHTAKEVDGLFLSSGIINGGVTTQDKLIDTADILRNKYQYKGYLHLKVMPGAEKAQVERAMKLATRLSVNLEAPNTTRLQKLAPKKAFTEELLRPLEWIDEIRKNESPRATWNGKWPSTVTQFVVGAVGETDLELLTTSEYLYKQRQLQRAYYSAFRPIVDTPMENLPPEDIRRQNRLYQSSFLLRDYGFDLEDLPFTQTGNLPLDTDPKLAWAQDNLTHKPIEINDARREELLRIPGIGTKGAAAILYYRRRIKIRALSDLKLMGIQPKRPAPFILLDGHRPHFQLGMF